MSSRLSLRTRFATSLLRGHFLLSPAVVPAWRLDVRTPPAAVLMVGTPVRSLSWRQLSSVKPWDDSDASPTTDSSGRATT